MIINADIEKTLSNKQYFIYDRGSRDTLLIQPVGEHSLQMMDSEVELIEQLSKSSCRPFTMVMFLVDWNRDLTPWEAEAVMGEEPFGCGASETLNFVTEQLIPEVTHGEPAEILLGGYSLAGLFALWAAYQTDLFSGVAAASPSVWYPGFPAFAEERESKVPNIYLSLGTKEEKTRNPVMKTVGDNIRRLQEILRADTNCADVVLEMNPGNHFREPDLRMAKGFAWLMDKEELK